MRVIEDVDAEASRIADFLVSIPANGNTTTTTKVFKAMLLKYDGCLMSHGYLWDIKGKKMGPGVYRISLERRES